MISYGKTAFCFISSCCSFFFYSPQSQVPAHLCTSPIPFEVPEDVEESLEGSSIVGGARRKKRRRKRMRSDTHLREEASSSSDEREREKEWERESDQAGQESPAKDESVTPLQLRLVNTTDTTEYLL